jgi:NAD(P)H-dependent FMN reductase
LRFLTISGSLRASSTNTTLLRALPLVAPEHAFDFPAPLDALPFFNADLEEAGPPASVRGWRAEIAGHDALVVCSPEYAHGVPGVLKNALDWLVGGTEVVGKPVGILNTSLPSTIAHASLVEILSVMGAVVVPEASGGLMLRGRRGDARALAADPEVAAHLRGVADVLSRSSGTRR